MAPKSAVAEDELSQSSVIPQPSGKRKRQPKRRERDEESMKHLVIDADPDAEHEDSLSVRLLQSVPPEPVAEHEEASEPQWELVEGSIEEEDSQETKALVPAKKNKRKTKIIVQGKKKKAKKAKSKKKKAKKEDLLPESTLKHDLVGLMLLGFALVSFLSLISFDAPNGVSLTSGAATQNWIGPFGAFLSHSLVLSFGFVGFGVPFAFAYMGILWLRHAFKRPPWTRTVGWAMVGLGTTCFMETIFGDVAGAQFPPGGVLGMLQAAALLPYLYPLGTAILALLCMFAGLLVALDKSLSEGVRFFGEEAELRIGMIRERYELWKEERRLLREEAQAIQESIEEERRIEAEKDAKEQKKEERKRAKEERQKRVQEKARTNIRQQIEQSLNANATDDSDDATVEKAKPVEGNEASGDSNAPHAIDLKEPAWVDAQADTDDVIKSLGTINLEDEAKSITGEKKETTADREQATGPKSQVGAEVLADGDDENALCIVEREYELGDTWESTRPALETESTFALPPLSMLDYDAPDVQPVSPETMLELAEKLTQKFQDFGIEGTMREVRPGPVVTTFEFIPAPGIKVSRIAALADDIAMAMEAVHVRIVAPIPGKGAVGIEIPNEKRETVFLKEIIASDSFSANSDKKLLMALGKDIQGTAYHADLAEMPHVLISGTTGSGKSVSVNAMICSILYRATPQEVKFLMIDPKMLELSVYEGIPHLLLPPIVDSKKAANALQWAVGEMERRYQAMSEMGVRDIIGFNTVYDEIKAGTDAQERKIPMDEKGNPVEKFPYIVVVIDEYADLLAIAGKDVESHIMRLAQKARASGIHVMLATQRPSVDVITGVIKANFPVRMGFRLASAHDSKTIINRKGAEKLLGRGDMLMMPAGTSNVTRVHGAYISEKELYRVISFLKKQGKPDYDMTIIDPPPDAEGEMGLSQNEEKDKKFDLAVDVVARSRKCSTSWLQRQLGVGYNRAARMVEMMEREGIVGPVLNAKGEREIFVRPTE